MTRLPRLALPLLARELTEQSRRRKTYVLRTVYAMLLFGFTYLQFDTVFTRLRENPLAALGEGESMFVWLIWAGIAAIYLLLPALVCSAVAGERERNTLPLLMITKLRPGTIVMEKLLSRMIPMLSLLLICMPLAAFFYALGGISQGQLWGGLWILLVVSIHVGSFSLMVSARSRTIVQALLRTYGWGVLLLFGIGTCLAFPAPPGPPGVDMTGPEFVVVASIVFLFTAVVFLVVARRSLVDAFSEDAPFLDQPAYSHTGTFHSLSPAVQRDDVKTLHDRPLLWRRWRKPTWSVLMAIGLVVEIFFASFLIADPDWLEPLYFTMWLFALPTITLAAATPMIAERVRQTRDVLLSTPLSGREIIDQLMTYVTRLMGPVVLLFLTLIIYGLASGPGMDSTSGEPELAFFLCWALSLAVYLPLVAWIVLLIGLKSKTQLQAIVLSLGLCFGSIIIAAQLDTRMWEWRLLTPFLPALVLFRNSAGLVDYGELLLNFGYYIIVLFAVERYCLRHADRLLGRVGAPEDVAWLPSWLSPAERSVRA